MGLGSVVADGPLPGGDVSGLFIISGEGSYSKLLKYLLRRMGRVSEVCGQCNAVAGDLCCVVDSFTRPDILRADLEEQT